MPDGNTAPSPQAEIPTPAKPRHKTTPIGIAVRDQLRQMLEVEVLNLATLQALAGTAAMARKLLSVRDPVSRFETKVATPMAYTMGGPEIFHCNTLSSESGYMGDNSWRLGPASQRYQEETEKAHERFVRSSPVLKAIAKELREVLHQETFTSAHLLEVEQLCTVTHGLMAAALGISTERPSNRRGVNVGYPGGSSGGWVDGSPMAPSSSPETFGAVMARELTAQTGKSASQESSLTDLVSALAKARETGETAVVNALEAKLQDKGLLPTQTADIPTEK